MTRGPRLSYSRLVVRPGHPSSSGPVQLRAGRGLSLSLAQFGALAILIAAGALVVHVGFVAAAYRLGVLNVPEALVSWLFLLVPLLIWATTSFSLSLTRPALLAYAILLGIPYLLLPLLAAFIGSWSTKVPGTVRLLSARAVDNWGLLFQVWVDIAAHPSRGREQADLIRRRVLRQVIEGAP